MKNACIIISLIVLFSCDQNNKQIAIDTCFDKGGSWNYGTNECEYGKNNKTNILIQNIQQTETKPIEKGLILPIDINAWNPCCLYIPMSGLKLYKSPNTKSIGHLRLTNQNQSSEFYESEIKYLNGDTDKYKLEYFEMVGYEIFALKYISAHSSYLQLENKLWVKIEELQEKGLKHKSWMRFAIEEENVLGWHGNKPGIELRRNPIEDAEPIMLLEGDLFEINLSEELQAEWIKVNVNEYQIHPCNDPNAKPIKKHSGWIKIISENGTLNIWNYRKGC